MKTLLPLLIALGACGCATTTQEMATAPETHVVLELRGVAPGGPVVVVGTAQIGLTAKPVGIDAANPLVSAAPNVNSPNSTAKSGDVGKPPAVAEEKAPATHE